MFKSKNNNKNDGGTSKKQKAMPAKIENKYEEHFSKKTQQEREKSATDNDLRSYIMSII